MNIKALKLELKNSQDLCSRYAALIKSLENDILCGAKLSMRDDAALMGYRFKFKQQTHNCEFINKRIRSGDDTSLVMGSCHAVTKRPERHGFTPKTVEESKAYLDKGGNETLMGVGWNEIQSMQQKA